MRLGGLSPFGPIFGKELRTAARRRRNYLLRVAYLIGLLLFLLLAWTITRDSSDGGGLARRAQQQEQLGTYFFAFFSMFCIGAMALVGPVLTSTAINGERQAKTLPVLLMTPLTAWQIVSGKLFSRLLTALTLIGLSLPVLALVRLLGGVELDQMFGVISLCAVTAMFGAALGLLFSILLRRAYAVILLSYMTMAVLYFFGPLLLVGLFAARGPRVPWFQFLGNYNIFWITGTLGWGEMRSMPVNWPLCAIIHLSVIAALLVLSAILVRRLARREGEGARSLSGVAAESNFVLATMNELGADEATVATAPTALRRRATRTVSDTPILWREVRRPLMFRRWQRIVAVIAVGGLLLLAYVAAGINHFLKDTGFQAFLACCFYTLMMLLTCVIAATCIAQEKESESWTVLLASPVSGSAIVWGKAIGVLRRLMWPMALVAVNFIVFAGAGVISPLEALIAIAVISAFNAIWVATGVAISLRFRKVTIAVIANLSLPIAVYGAGSLVLAVINSLTTDSDILFRQVTWYLPYYYLIEGISEAGRWSGSDLRRMPGTNDSVSLQVFAFIAVCVAGLHVLAAVGILHWTAMRLDRIVGRSEQVEPLDPPVIKPTPA